MRWIRASLAAAVLLAGCIGDQPEAGPSPTSSDATWTPEPAATATTSAGTSRPDQPLDFEQERARRLNDPPTLMNLAVDFGAMESPDFGDFYDPQEAADHNYLNNFRPIDPFGSGFGANSNENSSSVNFWIRPNVTLRSPVSGVFTSVEWQSDAEDFEIHLRRDASDWWIVSLDHVQPLDGDAERFKALVGTSIAAGDPIARPTLASTIGRGLGEVGQSIHGFVEIQVNFENHFGDPATYFQEWHCPALLLDPSPRSTVDARIRELEQRWEEAKGDPTIYDEARFLDTPACIERKLEPPQ